MGDPFGERMHGRAVGDVHRLFPRGRSPVRHHHGGAVRPQPRDHGGTDSTGAPGDHRDARSGPGAHVASRSARSPGRTRSA
ncbi:hypothetical protein Z951_34900 [Streptomyces sp. PRh5]|nr:hypothetical protein Z951_34900 [Streptomyces sp. PRh5]